MAWNSAVFGKSGFGALSANRFVDQLTRMWREAGKPSIAILHRRVGNDQYELWLCPASSSLAKNMLVAYGFEASAKAPSTDLYEKVSF